MNIGDKVFVRDGYITEDWMIPQGEIVHISYHKNSDVGEVYLVSFPNLKTHYFHRIALKTQ